MIYRNNDMVPIFKKEIKNTKKNSKFDITFYINVNKTDIKIILLYRKHLFSDEYISNLCKHFKKILNI